MWFVPSVNLIAGRDEIAISQFRADLDSHGASDSSWVNDLITGARDPLTGQEYMDRRYSEILESLPHDDVYYARMTLSTMYLLLGFTDRYYDMIFAADPNDQFTTDAEVFVWQGIVLRPDEFVSHPRYLEVAELLGITRTWEQRGPPDFCEKVKGNWDCD